MKTIHYKVLALCAGFFIATAAQAHDPSEHHGGEAPDCDAMMEHMDDMKGMDRDDPVMKAMMEQCGDEHEHGKSHKHKDRDHHHKHKDGDHRGHDDDHHHHDDDD